MKHFIFILAMSMIFVAMPIDLDMSTVNPTPHMVTNPASTLNVSLKLGSVVLTDLGDSYLVDTLVKKDASYLPVKPLLVNAVNLAKKHDIDPLLVISIMSVESTFKVNARSHCGARGLMQIMPVARRFVLKEMFKGFFYSAKTFGIPYSPEIIEKNNLRESTLGLKGKNIDVEVGVVYLKHLIIEFKDVKMAIIAYNMGPGWVRKHKNVGVRNNYLNKVTKTYSGLVALLHR